MVNFPNRWWVIKVPDMMVYAMYKDFVADSNNNISDSAPHWIEA